MKKFSMFKIIQLSLLIVISIVSVFLLLRPEVKQYVFSSKSATILFFIVWMVLIASFMFLLIDFNLISTIKLNYHNLYGVAYSDPLSGIPNRFSCDTIIEKYIDKELPANIGCVMIDLSNLPEVNSLYDHTTGNKLLKDFSSILSISALSVCFVGRNGGNKFLAIFEDSAQEKLDTFLNRLEKRVTHHNDSPNSIPIVYNIGIALNSKEHISHITKLIALANYRIYED